jgi:aminoglycoside phosphotransferase (APT) family kinase protein
MSSPSGGAPSTRGFCRPRPQARCAGLPRALQDREGRRTTIVVDDQSLVEAGLPSRAGITARYVARTGLDPAPGRWYEAFAQWKMVVVVQQVHIRWRQGASAAPRHERTADTAPALAATAIWHLDEPGL